MLRQQHLFSTDEWMSLRNSPFSVAENVWGVGRHQNLQPHHDKCSIIWSLNYQDHMLSTSCFFLILTVVKKIYRMFICGIVIQNYTCALATASYFWLMMNGCSWVIVIFCDKNVSLQVVSIQNLRIHAKCSAIWSGFTWPCARQNKECPEHNVTTGLVIL